MAQRYGANSSSCYLRCRLFVISKTAGVASPWTQRCVRQADCILLTALASADPAIGEFERMLIGLKTTARKELVLIHADRVCRAGCTASWLKSRVWVHGHHHVQMRLLKYTEKTRTINSLRSQFFSTSVVVKNSRGGVRSDFARLGRRLLSLTIGLVLGGFFYFTQVVVQRVLLM